MLFKKDRKIRNLQAMVSNRDRLIKDIEEQSLVLYKEKQQLLNENADIRCEIDELKDTLKLINKLMTSNQYENDQVIRNKIIELSDMTGNLQITQ